MMGRPLEQIEALARFLESNIATTDHRDDYSIVFLRDRLSLADRATVDGKLLPEYERLYGPNATQYLADKHSTIRWRWPWREQESVETYFFRVAQMMCTEIERTGSSTIIEVPHCKKNGERRRYDIETSKTLS